MKQSVYDFAKELRKNQTEAEAFFWQRVRKRKILGCLFLRQKVIEHANILGKSYFFIADFYCSEKSLIVEIDGPIHMEQVEYDTIREGTLIDMGHTVIRFTNEEVLNNWNLVNKKLSAKISELESRY